MRAVEVAPLLFWLPLTCIHSFVPIQCYHGSGYLRKPKSPSLLVVTTATTSDHHNVSFPTTSCSTNDANGTSSEPHVSTIRSARTNRITNTLLRISYDGGRFTGWSSGDSTSNNNATKTVQISRRKRRRGILPSGSGFVRSVEGIIQSSLAELFGKVDPRQVVVEGSSRTDKGVHATHMVALIYCLKEEFMPSNPELVKDDDDEDNYEDVINEHNKDETHGPAPLTDPSLLLQGYNKGIPGKRLPHPATPTDDTFFLRMCLNVPEFAIRLNHLLPADIRVTGYATPPATPHRYFHPSLNAIAKTYHYTFSVGMIHDPTEWRFVWQILEEDVFRLKQVEEACQLLQGTHDFAAFRGAPRGADDKRRQERESTVCTLYQVAIETVAPEMGIFPPRSDQPLQTFRVIISGNRFLYKMVRFLVGALVAIGTNAMKLSDLQAALTTSARPDNGGWQCAPPHGLVLQHVEFDPPVHWESL